MSELTYKKITDAEQIDIVNDGTTVFVNDGGALKQVAVNEITEGLVKSVNGVTPDENGAVEIESSGGGGAWDAVIQCEGDMPELTQGAEVLNTIFSFSSGSFADLMAKYKSGEPLRIALCLTGGYYEEEECYYKNMLTCVHVGGTYYDGDNDDDELYLGFIAPNWNCGYSITVQRGAGFRGGNMISFSVT